MKEIVLNTKHQRSKNYRKYKVLVDDEDYSSLITNSWSFGNNGYARRSDKYYKVNLMHRFIMNCPDDMEVDHINGNRLDNRRCNLRICNRTENCSNQLTQRRKKSSQYKGVSWDKTGNEWAAKIKCNGRTINLGDFENEHTAALMYDFWATYLFGEFAKPNFKVVSSFTEAGS